MARNVDLPTQSVTDRHLQPHLLNRTGGGAYAQIINSVQPTTPSDPGTPVFDYAASGESVSVEQGRYTSALLSAPIALVATGAVSASPWQYTAPAAIALDVAAIVTVEDMEDVAGLLLALRVRRDGGLPAYRQRWMDIGAASWATLDAERHIALYARVDLGPGDVLGASLRCLSVHTTPIIYDLRISATVST